MAVDRYRSAHRAPLFLLPLLVILTLPSSAQVESEAVIVSVRGVSGRALKAKRRHFLAVNVVLDNPSSVDSEGTLRVYRVRNPNRVTPDQSLFYERRVEVPRQGRRVETVYYYCQEQEPKNQLCVAYEPDEGPLNRAAGIRRGEGDVDQLTSREPAIGRCAADHGAASSLQSKSRMKRTFSGSKPLGAPSPWWPVWRR